MRSDPRFPRACINMSQEVEGHGIFKENPKLSGKWLESVKKETKFPPPIPEDKSISRLVKDVKEIKTRFERSEKIKRKPAGCMLNNLSSRKDCLK